jgi:hypothetical protein
MISRDLASKEEKDLDSEYSLLVYILVKTKFSVGGFWIKKQNDECTTRQPNGLSTVAAAFP